jgi:hypothetical protein
MKTQIMETKNYGLFELHEMNRSVDEDSKNFQLLVKSMQTHGFISAYPLHCVTNGGEKLKIKAGHNRFRAAQKAGVPIKYVISSDTATIHELENGGPGKWKNNDYLESYYNKSEDYRILKNFMDITGISLTNAASMFNNESAGSHNWQSGEKFKRGEYKIKNYEHPWQVGDIVLFLNKIGINWSGNSYLVKAISRVIWIPEFSIEHFKQKCKTHKYLIERQKDLQGYIGLIDLIYNYKTAKSKKIHIPIRVDEIMQQRNAVKK